MQSRHFSEIKPWTGIKLHLPSINRRRSSATALTYFGQEQIYADECQHCKALQEQGRIRFLLKPSEKERSLQDLCRLRFHAVPSRDPAVFRDWNDSRAVCSFCSHLHVKAWLGRSPDMAIYLDPFREILARQETCGFCSLIAKIVTRHKGFLGRRDIDNSRSQIVLRTANFGQRTHSFGRVLFTGQLPSVELETNAISLYSSSDTWSLSIITSVEAINWYRSVDICTLYGTVLGPHQKRKLLVEAESFVPELINWEDIRTQLEETDHPEPLTPQPAGFRLIDVEACNVVAAPTLCEYVALSYVWGKARVGVKPFHLSLGNIRALQRPNSLNHPGVPATITDAMIACRGLGKRYLWVDRFCIPQDEYDNPTKHVQIEAMDRIYSHAFVTLVALEGEDSNHGLAGVSTLKRDVAYRTQFSGCEISEKFTPLDFGKRVEESCWNSRGWTMQEAMLSSRLLFFTQDGVVGESSRGRFFEQGLEAKVVTPVTGAPNFWAHEDQQISLSNAVNQMSKRQFGRESDILDAFSGILTAQFGEHRFGLPLEGFEDALCWMACTPWQRRTSTEEHVFPSWSWASVPGEVRMLNAALFSVALFGFLETDQTGTPCLYHFRPRDRNFLDDGEAILAATTAWQTSCLQAPLHDFLRPTRNPRLFRSFVSEFKRRWPSYRHLWEHIHGIKQDDWRPRNFLDKFSPLQIQHATEPGRLLVFTQMTLLSLASLPLPYLQSFAGHFLIFDGEHPIGEACLDTKQIVKELRNRIIPDYTRHQTTRSATDTRKIVFIAMSIVDREGITNWEIGKASDSDFAIPITQFIFEDDFRPRTDLFMIVMAIETKAGISRRLGIGAIPLEKWLRLPRVFKGFVLE